MMQPFDQLPRNPFFSERRAWPPLIRRYLRGLRQLARQGCEAQTIDKQRETIVAIVIRGYT